ncbi:alpha/beta hydrolase [Ancylobacter polymorphus]|uniref:Prolyl oligopeptidase family serine peptidase n=1 Tax=Ancylobacter polymorphus TaxID=223390 RepID=A0A9E6ZYA9_9HYPH|nr:prolyl oligopeptidase family serine peptidase [Ancylobacter polymorphus]UOK72616.1 prolyl oligopeptidase family serine peptidase [Ancylobacter polymorphus]
MLDGPRLSPRSGGPATSLVVLLHGYGADGRDLIDLGDYWAPLLPNTAFVSPHAPEPLAIAPVGRQWFGYTERNDRERWVGVQSAQRALDSFLDAELARLNLPGSRLALVGFSQGTMMALHVGLRRKVAPAGIVGFSGIHVLPPEGATAAFAEEITARPPVLLIHGDLDQVIPPMALPRAVESLQQQGVAVRAHLSNGLAHGIDGTGLSLAGTFLTEVLA